MRFPRLLPALVCISCFIYAIPAYAQVVSSLNQERLAAIDDIAAEGLASERMPGCVVLVGYQSEVAYLKAYGDRQLLPAKLAMQTDTLFDLASLTKPIATATSVMKLIEEGQVKLQDPVSKHLPNFTGHGKEAITIKQLLTHQGGLIPDNSIKDYQHGIEAAFENINRLTLREDPGTTFIYSDVGFVVLGRLVEKITHQSLHEFTQQQIFRPLKMDSTGYLPNSKLQQTAAPTEQRDGQWMQGEVHDPRAYLLGGVAGHAGLFSTAEDLSRYARMIINGGELDGVRILNKETVKLMRTPVEVSSGIRTLGWDMKTGYSSNRGDLFSASAIGHGGFTGTGLWIDAEKGLYVIFLSNRVHPDGKGSVNTLIGRIGTIAAAAIPH